MPRRRSAADWAAAAADAKALGIASAAKNCNNWLRCRTEVEDDSPSHYGCKACMARVDAQRAAGALRQKMPSIWAGMRAFGAYLLKKKH